MVKYLSFHNSSFALRYFLMQMARPQCDTLLVYLFIKEYQFSLNSRKFTTNIEKLIVPLFSLLRHFGESLKSSSIHKIQLEGEERLDSKALDQNCHQSSEISTLCTKKVHYNRIVI